MQSTVWKVVLSVNGFMLFLAAVAALLLFLAEFHNPGLWAKKVWSVSVDFSDSVDRNQDWLDPSEAIWVQTNILQDAQDFVHDNTGLQQNLRYLWLYIENTSGKHLKIEKIANVHYLFFGRMSWREDQSIMLGDEDQPSEVSIEEFSVDIELPPGKRLFFLLGLFLSFDDRNTKLDEICYFRTPITVIRNVPPLSCVSRSFTLPANDCIPPSHYRLPD